MSVGFRIINTVRDLQVFFRLSISTLVDILMCEGVYVETISEITNDEGNEITEEEAEWRRVMMMKMMRFDSDWLIIVC